MTTSTSGTHLTAPSSYFFSFALFLLTFLPLLPPCSYNTRIRTQAHTHTRARARCRYNKVLLDKLAIEREKERLQKENTELQGILKQYLDGISVNEDVMAQVGPHTYAHARTHTHTCTYKHKHKHTQPSHKHTHAHSHTHTHTRTLTHALTHALTHDCAAEPAAGGERARQPEERASGCEPERGGRQPHGGNRPGEHQATLLTQRCS